MNELLSLTPTLSYSLKLPKRPHDAAAKANDQDDKAEGLVNVGHGVTGSAPKRAAEPNDQAGAATECKA